MREDASFPALVARLAHPRTVWLLAGRPDSFGAAEESVLGPATFGPTCVAVPPNGVPSMNGDEVRAMLIAGLDRQALKLIEIEARNQAESGKNAFVEKVTRNADGRPIYVDLLLRDLGEGTYDIRTDTVLPASFRAYQQELVRRAGRGSKNLDGTALLCTMALADVPLTVEAIGTMICHPGVEKTLRTNRARAAVQASTEFCEPVAGDEDRYKFSHNLWREFIAGRDDTGIPPSEDFVTILPEFHARFVACSLNPPSEPPDLAWHFQVRGPSYVLRWGGEAGVEKMVAKVASAGWLSARLSGGTAVERHALVTDLTDLLKKVTAKPTVAATLLDIEFPKEGDTGDTARIRDAWHDIAAIILADNPTLLDARMLSAPANPTTLGAVAALATALSNSVADRDRAPPYFAHLGRIVAKGRAEHGAEFAEECLATAGSTLLASNATGAARPLLQALREVTAGPQLIWRNRRGIPALGQLWARLFVAWPTHPDLTAAVRTFGRGLINGPVRLALRLSRRVLGWQLVRFIYPVVERRWKEIARNKGRERDLDLANVVSISDSAVGKRLSSLTQLLLEDLHGEVTADVWLRAMALAIVSGSVTEKDPCWQVQRGLHGSLLYIMNRRAPTRFETDYVQPFIQNQPEKLPNADAGAMERLCDMLIRSRSYAAFDAGRLQNDDTTIHLPDLHDRLLRSEVTHWPNSFLSTHNLVGRLNVHQLCTIAFLERPGDSLELPRTRTFLTHHRDAGRLDVLGKGWLDLIYVATWHPDAALNLLGTMVVIDALGDEGLDDANGRPAAKAAARFVSPKSPSDLSPEAAARWALAVHSISIMAPAAGATFRTRWKIDTKAAARLDRWASYATEVTKIVPPGADRATFIRQILDNARIGQFMNVLILQSPPVRRTMKRVLDRWIAMCQAGNWKILSERDRGRLLGFVLAEVISLALDLLAATPSPEPEPAP